MAGGLIMTSVNKDFQLADQQWQRFQSAMTRGHHDYQRVARRNEDFYLGGGKQWSEDIIQELERQGKPWLEQNIIFSTINSVLGTQTQSRMDIAYKPRDGSEGDQDISDILTKLSMFLVDQNQTPWKESQVFADGLIQQRGYFEVKLDFSENMYGDARIEVLDPLDVIPDPDAKSYDPDDWNDVITTSWVPLDDIKETYGLAKWRRVLESSGDETDWGEDSFGEERNKFSNSTTYHSFYKDSGSIPHVRVLNRQHWKLQTREYFFDIPTGELLVVPDGLSSAEKKKMAKERDAEIVKRTVKRVRWTVSTSEVILHDAWSPYDQFTIVPYFPYFRRGVTVGLVDNLIKTQEMINKVYSQMLHIVNSTANSGWIVEEDSLVNMDVEDLEELGSQTGLLLEVKSGREKPIKIEPNTIPTGLRDLVTTGVDLIRLISGVSETFQGGGGPETSGAAIQSRIAQSAVQLATPIDNLFRTRHMLASRLLKLLQQFYTEERTFLIVGNDEEGKEITEKVTINEEIGDGVANDLTVGKYDVVITDVPTQVTFQNSQFAQAIDMRKFGVAIPDAEMVKLSTLSRKNEISKQLEGGVTQEQELQNQQESQLNLDVLRKQVEKLESEIKEKDSQSIKELSEVALLIKDNPSVAPILDVLAKSLESNNSNKSKENIEDSQELEKPNPRLGTVNENI